MLRHHSVQRLLRFADEINFEELREFLMASAPFRTVMLGAMLSPAWYAVCTDSLPEFHCCPRCGQHTANFAHMVYQCPALESPPVRPENPWQYRLGWPVKGLAKEENRARLLSLAAASEALRVQGHE